MGYEEEKDDHIRLEFVKPNKSYVLRYGIQGIVISGFVILAVSSATLPLTSAINVGFVMIPIMTFWVMVYKSIIHNLQNDTKKLEELIEDYKSKEIEIVSSKSNHITLSDRTKFDIDIDHPHYWKVAKILFKIGVSADFKDRNGRTPLMYVVSRRKISKKQSELAEQLIENGANIKTIDKDGNTALMHFLSNCDPKNNHNLAILKILLPKKDEYVNMFNNLGCSALIYCANSNLSKSVTQYLLECGADINIKNKNGKNAIKIAEDIGNYDFIRYLTNQKDEEIPRQDKDFLNQPSLDIQSKDPQQFQWDKKEPNEVSDNKHKYYDEAKTRSYPNRKQQKLERHYQTQKLEKDLDANKQENKIQKLAEAWLLGINNVVEFKELAKSIVNFLSEKLNFIENIDQIVLKGSSLYRYYLPDKTTVNPNDIDLEIISTKLLYNQNLQDLKTMVCQLFGVQGEINLQNFKVWRGHKGADDNTTMKIWNLEFLLDKEQTKLPLPLNIIIRDEKHLNLPDKDWVASVDALRLLLYKKDVFSLRKRPELYLCDGCAINLEDVVQNLSEGKFVSNPYNYSKRMGKYGEIGLKEVDKQSPSTSPKPSSNNLIYPSTPTRFCV